MYLFQYLDVRKLAQYLNEGKVEVKYHNDLPLRLFLFSREVHCKGPWDDVTTKCRGLIVGPHGKIIARPFEKFFGLNTEGMPETYLSNLPPEQPVVMEKLNGSLGIHYAYNGVSGIATKGSFHSEHAEWATRWYRQWCVNPQWPEEHTPLFEIINERIHRHAVNYHGREKMVLLAIINNNTGEEVDYNSLHHWASINGLETAEVYNKSVGTVINEDRKNHEGYVLSWPRPGQPPLKLKIKHPNFLALRSVIHAATPKAILECLQSRKISLLDTWIGQTTEPIGAWVKHWVTKFNFKYAEVLLKSGQAFYHANVAASRVSPEEGRKTFALAVREHAPQYASICFARLDGKDLQPLVWKEVAKTFESELAQPFSIEG